MNVKKARALRKQVGFHPSESPRVYDTLTIYTGMGKVVNVPTTTVNHEKSLRAKYQVAKGRGQ